MKQIIITFLAILFSTTIIAQSNWREKESELRVFIENNAQYETLKQLKVNGEFYPNGTANVFVVPAEKKILEALGFNFVVVTENLNEAYKNFWETKEAYHSYTEIINVMNNLVTLYPEICTKVVFGTSVQGRELSALKISDNVEIDEPEAEVMFDGGIHGDEIGGPENMIRFAENICEAYNTDPDITELINNREIWLYMMVNPDGRVNMERENANGVDINRDAGYMWDSWGGSPTAFSEVESRALRQCSYNNQFVVHTTYHSGTEYISCPWSYRSSAPNDNTHILQLAGLYASTSGYSNMPFGQGNTGMYAINGSTKDTNYGSMGAISWSMEISMEKQPPTSQILTFYNYNEPSMLAMIEYAGYGIEGIVTDIVTNEPVQAAVFVNTYYPCYTDSTAGDFHKYVLPGTYSITVVANGYETQTVNNIVVTQNNATAVNVQLTPQAGNYIYKVCASQIPGNNESDEGYTPAVLGAPDNVNYSIGKSGWIIVDMQYAVTDGAGNDILITEGDATPESFFAYVSNSIDGPWFFIGNGTGSTPFDFNGIIDEARYVKIVDDGDGTAIAANAGFDLDAMEALEHVSGVYLSLIDYTIDDSTTGNANGRFDAGEEVIVNVQIRNGGDITAENTLGTLTFTDDYITINNSTLNFGTLQQGDVQNVTFTMTSAEDTPLAHLAELNLALSANSGSYTNDFLLYFTIGLIIEDWESQNFNQFAWVNGGNSPWTIDNTTAYEGEASSKSGDINDDQNSELSLEYNVLIAGEISFAVKISSESNYDELIFYVDGSEVQSWSGTADWAEVTFPLSTGTHILKWSYEKDGSLSSGSDCGWIDNIIFPQGTLANLPPTFVSNAVTTAKEGVEYNYNITTTDPNGNSINIEAETLPEWLTLLDNGNGTGNLFGTPSAGMSGNVNVTLIASDGSAQSTQAYTISIEENTAPEFSNTPITDVELNSPYSYDIETYDPDTENTITITSETLPTWLSLTDNGDGTALLSGTSVEFDSNFEITLLLSDGVVENPVEQTFTIVVGEGSGVSDISNNYSIFPNPAQNFVTITSKVNIEDVTVTIYDILGNEISQTYILNGNTLTIDLENLKGGMYFVKLLNNQQLTTLQFIVE